MRTPVSGILGLLAMAALATGVLFGLPGRPLLASAQSATGVVTGQVVWSYPLPVSYAIPDESVPDVAPDVSPEASPDTGAGADSGVGPQADPGTGVQAMPAPGRPVPVRPSIPRPIPAGAVLVAIQGTSLSARTDESGRFRIEGVPVGQYLTIAAGPVRGMGNIYAVRPNIFIQEAGGTVDVGRLGLGQPYVYGPMPYGAPDTAQGQPSE